MPADPENRTHEHAFYALLSAAVFCALVGCTLIFAGRGYDFTDEGLYLAWAADPWRYSASTSQFGFVYHPLYLLVGGDIANLRRASVLISAALTVTLMWVALRKASAGNGITPARTAGHALGLGTAFLTTCHQWLPTPSYNSLDFQAIVVVLIGMALLLDAPARRTVILASALVGLGGWLAFMAKPPTALGLGVIACVFILAGVCQRILALAAAIAVALALLVASAFAIDGSVAAFIQRYEEGIRYYHALFGEDLSQSIFARGALMIGTREQIIFAAAFATTLALAILLILTGNRGRPIRFVAMVALAAAAVAFVAVGAPPRWLLARAEMQPIWIAAPAAAAAFAVALFRRPPPTDSWRTVVLVLLLLPVPFLFALGTSNFLWERAVIAGAPWVAAAAMMTVRAVPSERLEAILAPLSLNTAAVASLLLAIGLHEPYRQLVPLMRQHTPAQVGPHSSSLLVDEATGAYLSTLRDAAARDGFAPDTPILDLTGGHPGTVFALGGSAPGQPWLIGGYSLSEDYVRLIFAKLSCSALADAWLLDTPDGPRRIPPSVALGSGIDATSYAEVARLQSPDAQGQHVLLKPQRPAETERRCEAARGAS